MESRLKLLGHPVHQLLVVFPLGVLTTAVIFDLMSLLRRENDWSEMAYWIILAGIIGGLLAAGFGLIDWLAVPAATRTKAIGLWHGLGNVIVIGLFIVSWMLRFDYRIRPSWLALAFSFLGAGGALVIGWLGSNLAERLGAEVDPGTSVAPPGTFGEIRREKRENRY